MKRVADWRIRFDAEIDNIRRIPFAWGKHDCAVSLGARMVKAITGEDIAAEYRGRYKTAAGALKLLRKHGFDDLESLVASLFPEIPVSFARIGDVVVIPSDDEFGCSIGVVNGERIFVLREDGLGTVDLLRAKRAFKVG